MIKLHEVKTPVVEVEITPGDVRQFDPYEIARRIEPRLREGLGFGETITVIREALGLGVDQASDHKVLYLNRLLLEFVAEQISSKGVPPALQT